MVIYNDLRDSGLEVYSEVLPKKKTLFAKFKVGLHFKRHLLQVLDDQL